jgi:hypothetical protein
MTARAGVAAVGVSSVGALGVLVDLLNVTGAVGGPNAALSALVVPVYSIADVAGVLAASVLFSVTRGRDGLASAALALASAPFLAFYAFLIVTRPVEAADRAKGALAVVWDVFSALAEFVVHVFT